MKDGKCLPKNAKSLMMKNLSCCVARQLCYQTGGRFQRPMKRHCVSFSVLAQASSDARGRVENVAPTFYNRKSVPMEAGKGRVFHVLIHC